MQSRKRRFARLAAAVAATTFGLGAVLATGPASAQDTVTFAVGTTQDIDSINPLVGALVIDYEIWNLQYATLTDKAADDFAVTPGLAESWEVSDDGLTVTYTLREGLEWSDGQPLTADDIAYTINRSRDEEWINHIATTANLDAMVIDERTVEITTSVPDPKLPVMDVYIVPKHIYDQYDAEAIYEYDGQDGVGSGPFTVTEVRKGEFIRMAKNPNWWGQEPVMDEVVFRIFADTPAQYEALNAGELDAVDEIPAQIFTTLDPDGDIAPIAGNQGGLRRAGHERGLRAAGRRPPGVEGREGPPGHQLRHRPRPPGREGPERPGHAG